MGQMRRSTPGRRLAAMAETPRYALALSDAEIARYRMMAEMARTDEAAEWDRAGIIAGARIVDIGCGPGLIAVELAQIAGPTGRVVAVDREADAVETARSLLHERGYRRPGLFMHRSGALVSPDVADGDTHCVDLCRDLLGPLAVATVDDHRGAVLRQHACGRLTDAAAAARDQCAPAFEF